MNDVLNILYTSQSERGRRPTNDDCILIDHAKGLYLLCDGAKGTYGGRTAGELACQVIAQQSEALAGGIGQALGPEAEGLVERVVLKAHQQILQAAVVVQPD